MSPVEVPAQVGASSSAPDTAWLVTNGGTLLRTTDAATTWRAIANPFGDGAVRLALDATNPDRAWAGSLTGHGIRRTIDGAHTGARSPRRPVGPRSRSPPTRAVARRCSCSGEHPPRLRMRHAPFAIDEDAHDRWLKHMRAALDEQRLAPELDAALWTHLVNAAAHMRNA